MAYYRCYSPRPVTPGRRLQPGGNGDRDQSAESDVRAGEKGADQDPIPGPIGLLGPDLSGHLGHFLGFSSDHLVPPRLALGGLCQPALLLEEIPTIASALPGLDGTRPEPGTTGSRVTLLAVRQSRRSLGRRPDTECGLCQYDQSMTRKIAISLSDEQAASAVAAVATGRAPSVSAYIGDAIERVERERGLADLLSDLDNELGPIPADKYAWADSVLKLK